MRLSRACGLTEVTATAHSASEVSFMSSTYVASPHTCECKQGTWNRVGDGGSLTQVVIAGIKVHIEGDPHLTKCSNRNNIHAGDDPFQHGRR
jgi:hypothetical protein